MQTTFPELEYAAKKMRTRREAYAQTRETGIGVVDTRWRRKDGEIRDIFLSSALIDPADPGKGVTFSTQDITERKQAEVALLKSRDLLKSIVEHVPAWIFWKARDLRYLGCNTQFARDAGCSSPDELTCMNDFVAKPESIRAAIAAHDFKQLAFLTHSLKGMAGDILPGQICP